MKALLERPEADVNRGRRRDDATPLYIACQNGHVTHMKSWPQANADVNCLSRATAFFIASQLLGLGPEKFSTSGPAIVSFQFLAFVEFDSSLLSFVSVAKQTLRNGMDTVSKLLAPGADSNSSICQDRVAVVDCKRRACAPRNKVNRPGKGRTCACPEWARRELDLLILQIQQCIKKKDDLKNICNMLADIGQRILGIPRRRNPYGTMELEITRIVRAISGYSEQDVEWLAQNVLAQVRSRLLLHLIELCPSASSLFFPEELPRY